MLDVAYSKSFIIHLLWCCIYISLSLYMLEACSYTSTVTMSMAMGDKQLVGYSYKEEKVQSPLSCGRKCVTDEKCQSVNFLSKTGLCQMNSECHLTAPGALTATPYSEYYYVNSWTKQMQLGICNTGPCSSGNACNAFSEARFRCDDSRVTNNTGTTATYEHTTTACTPSVGCIGCLASEYATTHNGKTVKYKPIGCFTYKPMTQFLQSYREDMDVFDMVPTVKKCARTAHSAGHVYFGIEYYGECWVTPNLTTLSYTSQNLISAAKCSSTTHQGTGGQHIQCVYKIL